MTRPRLSVPLASSAVDGCSTRSGDPVTSKGNLRVYMAQLRRKLEPDHHRPRFLLNEPGMGYRFEPGETSYREA